MLHLEYVILAISTFKARLAILMINHVLFERRRFNRLVWAVFAIMHLHRVRLGIVRVPILVFWMDHLVSAQMRHANHIVLTIATLVIALVVLMMHQMGLLELRDIIRLVGTHLARVDLFLGLHFVNGLVIVRVLQHFVMLDTQAVRCIVLAVSALDWVFLVVVIEQVLLQVEYVHRFEWARLAKVHLAVALDAVVVYCGLLDQVGRLEFVTVAAYE